MFEDDEKNLKDTKIEVKIWKKIIGIAFKRKREFILIISCMIFCSLCGMVAVLLDSYALKNFFSEETNFSYVIIFIIGYILVGIINFIFVYIFLKNACNMDAILGQEIKTTAFKNLQNLSYSYFDKTKAGWIMARLTSDSGQLGSILSWSIVDIGWCVTDILVCFIITFIINYKLALIVLIAVPLMVMIAYYLNKRVLEAHRDSRKANSEVTAKFSESFLGSKTIKTLNLEKHFEEVFTSTAVILRKKAITAIFFSSILWPFMTFTMYIALGFIYGFGGNMVILGQELTAVQFYIFMTFTMRLYDPITIITNVYVELKKAQASAERVISIIEEKSDVTDSVEVEKKYGNIFEQHYENFEEIKGDIIFENVDFRYEKGEQVLEKFNLSVKAGETIAIVGATGAGKTTIVNLLMRFYEPTSGRILIDGVDYKERSLGYLRTNIGYIAQTPYLFNDTIRNNILYGDLGASEEDVINSLEIIKAYERFSKFESGLDFKVGEQGNKLSLGEKQLLAFSRALIKKPKIVILDEATSSVDTETERLVQEGLHYLTKGKTSFVIAHRLSTIIASDKILVIENGKIIEVGSHDDLIKKEGHYYQLYNSQFISDKMEEGVR